MADAALSDQDIASKFQEFDKQKQPAPVTPTNQPAPTVSDGDIADRFRQFDQARSESRFPQGGPETPNATKVGFLEAVGEAGKKIPRPSAQDISELPNLLTPNLSSEEILHQQRATPGTAAKIASGALQANNQALAYVATLGPVLGAVSKLSPLIGRLISAGTAVDIGTHLPDMYRQITKAADEGDEEGVARGVADMGLGAWFAAQSTLHAAEPGAAAESPLLAKVLTKEVKSKIAPDELKEIFERVKANQGTPAENELVKFMAENPGVTEVSQVQPRFKSERFNRYMGLTKGGKANLSLARRPVQEESEQPSAEPIPTEESNAAIIREEKRQPQREGTDDELQAQGANREQPTAQRESSPEAIRGDQPINGAAPQEPTVAEQPAIPERSSAENQPPLRSMAMAKQMGRPLVQTIGPDGQSYWMTFDGYYELPAGGHVAALSATTQDTPGVGYRSSTTAVGLQRKGFKIVGDVPSVEAWTQSPNARAPIELPDSEVEPVKQHTTVDGMDVTIENPKGSTRTGTDARGKQWSVTMPADYGYFKRTTGKDGEQVDVYLGPDTATGKVFVVDQLNAETGQHDEQKILYGFPDQQAATTTYDAAFSDGRGPQRRGAVTELSKEQFRDWLKNGDKELPVARPGDSTVPAPPAPPVVSDESAMSALPAGTRAVATTGTQLATGAKEILDLLPRSGLPKEAVGMVTDLLSQPVFQNLDLSKLQLEVRNQVMSGRVPVAGSILDNVIQISRTASDAQTLPHELFHLIFDMLSPEDQALVERWRRKEIEDKYGDDAPAGLVAGTMTSEQALNGGMPIDDYHLINPSEYLAHMGSSQFARENQPDAKTLSFLDRLRNWIRGIIDAVRRFLNVSPTIDELVRDILAGKRVTSPKSGKDYEARATYSKTSKDAINAEKIASSAEERRIEGEHQLAQASDIVGAIEKHGGKTLSSGAARILRYGEFIGIQAAGERLLGKSADYRALKASSPDQTTWRARLAATQWNQFRHVLDDAIAQRDKELPRITSPSFLKTLAKEAAAKARFDTAENNVRIMKALFNTAIRKATKAMKFEAKSQREIDDLAGQVREIEEAMASSAAMTQLMTDMVSVLSSTNEGVSLLFDPAFGNRTDIIKVYRDLKISADQPIHSPTLLKWAAYLIQKSKRVRENLVAELIGATAPGRAAMTTHEKMLTDGLQENPVKTIKDILRGGGRMATERERAAFAWRVLHKKVTERLEEFATLDQAAKVAEGIKSDPDVKALMTEINHDAGWVGSQKPFEVFQDRTIVMPDKTEVSVGPDYFVGNNVDFVQNRAKVETAITTLKTWLADPVNADNENFGVHERNAQSLEDYFTGMALLQPSDPIKVFNATFGILQNSADLIGGRSAVGVRKSIRKYEVLHSYSSQWIQKWSYKLTASRVEAMKSHNMKWGSMGEVSLAEANKVWWSKVGNILTYSFNRQQGGFAVGDVLPTGWTVTAQDLRNVQLMSQAPDEAFSAVARILSKADAPYVTDSIGDYLFYRTPLKGSKLITPRAFNRKMMDVGRRISEALTRHTDATKAGDLTAASRALDEIVQVLDQNWNVLGPGLVWDRNADFAHDTMFDGPGGALQFLAPDVYKYHSATDFFGEVEALTGTPAAKVREILALEWARPIQGWHNEAKAEESGVSISRAAEQGNSFTRSRNQAFAPYPFYEYGFENSGSMARFGSGMQSRAMDELVASFRMAEVDVQRQMDEFQNEVQRLRAAGVKAPGKEAKSAMDIERANSRNSDNYQLIEKRLKEIDRVITALTGRESNDADVVAGRLIGLVTGSLIGMYTTARNITDGPRYAGQVANRLMAANLQAYPVAFFYGIIRAQAPFLMSAGVSTAKLALYKLPIQGPMVALYRFITQPDRSARKFMMDLLDPFLKEIGEDLYNRIKVVRQMVADGVIDGLNSTETELNARLLGSLLSGGQLMDAELSFAQKLALAPISIAELVFLNASQKVNPKFGDYSLNASVYLLMKSGLGPMKYHADRWRQIAAQIKSGARAFDVSRPDNLVNRLTHNEVFPALSGMRLASSEGDMIFLREVFAKAGLDYDAVAWKFITQVLNGATKPEPFTPEEEKALINATINMTNRATAANAPQFTKSRSALAKWLSPFWNWVTRMLSNFLNLMAVPAQLGRKISSKAELNKARTRQWAYVAMTVILPALALGALVGVGSNEEARAIKKLVYNQVMAYRQPWEREGGKSQAVGWAVEGLNNIPIVGGLISMAINDIPVRATMDPNFVMLSKIKDIAAYAGGVMQTGDFGYKLPELAIGLVPDARIVLSRLPFFEGRQELNNAASVLRRYGPMDSMRPMGGPRGGVATELTPYGDRMANAAIAGDMGSFQSIYQEAVAKATEMGKENPEQVVREMFRSRNPYDRVFKSKLTDAQREQILQSASPAERAMVQSVEQKFSEAAASIGATANFTAENASASRNSRPADGGIGAVGPASYNPLAATAGGGTAGGGSGIGGSGESAGVGGAIGGRRASGRRLSSGRTRIRGGFSRGSGKASLRSTAGRRMTPVAKSYSRRAGSRRKASMSMMR
jgi:tetrahydromethanopterin S-methyltransferase subunit G